MICSECGNLTGESHWKCSIKKGHWCNECFPEIGCFEAHPMECPTLVVPEFDGPVPSDAESKRAES